MPSSISSNASTSQAKRKDSQNGPSEKLLPLLHTKLRKLLLRSQSANITEQDPVVKGTYLGNVITTFPKGNGSLERPASALWKNHVHGRGSIRMTVTVCPAGLQAETREHGLTEYWNNRLTWCGVPHDYPKLFCWIYRHEGRKLKQELRCHALLCSKEDAKILSESLRNRLAEALFDFRKEKLLRQNARLTSLENYLHYYATSVDSISNYKRERTSPSKLSIIEELEEESLLPELSGIDKVIHLLEMDLSPSPTEYTEQSRPHSLTSTDSGDSNLTTATGYASEDEVGNQSPPLMSLHPKVVYEQISYEL